MGKKPNTYLLNDFQKLMVVLHTEEYEEAIKFKDAYKPGQANDKPVTRLDIIQRIWEELLPHRKIVKKAGVIETYPVGNPEKKYNASEMSDGERVIFYLIGEAVSVPKNSILIIDEPEMHLHKSLTKKLWDKIEQERLDCTFIYLTHDIDFASSRYSAKKIWLKSYDGALWDYEILGENSALPESLYLEILGSRNPILFIEGDDSSIDYKLYQAVFSEYTVKPLGSCTKVFETTKSFGDEKTYHHIESIGLIDRDRRTEEEIVHINSQGIWVTEVAEAENFLLLEDVIKVVASAMGKDPEEICKVVKGNVVEFFNKQLESQSVQSTISHVELYFKNATNLNSVHEFKELQNNLSDFWGRLQFESVYNNIKSSFGKLVETKDYGGILKVFNNKGLIATSHVSELCDLSSRNNAYLNFVVTALKKGTDESNRIKRAIKDSIRK